MCVIAFAMFAFYSTGIAAETGKANINVVIVFPGGPSAGEDGQRVIDQFLAILGQDSSLGKQTIRGSYFTRTSAALNHLETQPDTFIMGSLGFFLTHRKSHNLLPVAKIDGFESDQNQYHLVVKKGTFENIADMQGKTISGNTLYEDPTFLSRIVFSNTVDVSSHFVLKPTSRPLSAIRKVVRGTLDGVLLNDGQHTSLSTMSMAGELDTIYVSPNLPHLGMMMIDTASTRKHKAGMLNAVNSMCGSTEGKQACENFGIKAFRTATLEELSDVIRAMEE